MRILLVHSRYRSASPSGENRVVDQEHRALLAAGHEVRSFERASDDIARMPLYQRALVPAGAVWSRRAKVDLDREIGHWRPDVVHVHNVVPLLSPSVLVSCDGAKVPCVVTLHNFQRTCASGSLYRTGTECTDCVGRSLALPAVRHGCYRGSRAATVPLAVSDVVNRRAWQKIPSAYLFLSEAQRRDLAPAGFPPWRCFVKPNMVEDPTSTVGPGRPGRQGSRLVVYAGRLVEAKGVRTLMRAWDLYERSSAGSPGVAGAGGRLHLAIAGAGPLEGQVRSWAAGRSRVELLGALPPEGCARLVGRAVAVVVPSEWREPFGLVVAEAMAAGVPPVASSQGALPELVEGGTDGLLFPPGDAEALAVLLGRVDGTPSRMADLGAAARKTYERRFAPRVVVSQLESIYRFAVRHPSWVEEPPPSADGPAVAARDLSAAARPTATGPATAAAAGSA